MGSKEAQGLVATCHYDNQTESVTYKFPESARKDEAKNEQIVSVRQLFQFASTKDRVLLLFGILASLSSAVVNPVVFVYLGKLADVFVQNKVGKAFPECLLTNNETEANDTTNIIELGAPLCASIAVAGLIQLICSVIMIITFNVVAENQAFAIRTKFMKSVLRQDLAWFDQQNLGNFTNSIAQDLKIVRDGIGTKLVTLVNMLCSSLALIILAICTGWKLALVYLATVPVVILSLGIGSKIQTKLTSSESDAYSRAGAVAEEVISAIKTVAAFGGEKKEIERYSKFLEEAKKAGIRSKFFSGLSAGIFWLSVYLSYALVLWYGTHLVLEARCHLGGYDSRTLYIVFCAIAQGGVMLGQTSSYSEALNASKGAAKKLFDIIASEPNIDIFSKEGVMPSAVEGRITFLDVAFCYPSRPDAQVLRKMSFEAVTGETVALVGPSGCGKTTVIQLLQRFYDVCGGCIRVDGVDVREWNLAYLREHMGVVGQEPVLFDTTIAQNIGYGCAGDCSTEEVVRAAKLANAHDFILALPEQYETRVGELGAQLSGGQKQRIAIARAVVKNPRILLLDEATASLDSASEVVVQEALDKVRFGRTTIVVAHRLSTVRNSNRIIVMEEGQVKEFGNHQELMEACGLYYRLVTTQSDLKEVKFENRREDIWVKKENIVFGSSGSIASHNSHVVDENQGIKISADEATSVIRWLLNMVIVDWPFILVATIGSFINGTTTSVVAIFFATILGSLSKEREEAEKDVGICTPGFVIIGTAMFFASFIKKYMNGISGERLTMRIRKLLFEKILSREMFWFDEKANSTGVVCYRLLNDASNVKEVSGIQLDVVMQIFFSWMAATVVSLVYNYKYGLLTLVCLPLIFLGNMATHKIQFGNVLGEVKAVEAATNVGVSAVQNIRTVASLNLQHKLYDDYVLSLSNSLRQSKKKSYYYGLVYGASVTVVWFCYAASFFYGIYLVAAKEIRYTDIYAVVYAVFATALQTTATLNMAPSFQLTKTSVLRIFKLLSTKSTLDPFSTHGKKFDCRGKIVFLNVGFKYPSRTDVEVLRGLSLEVNPGESVALVGASGCGKTTCIQLLERFYQISNGHVLLDGVDIGDLNIGWLRSQLGIVAQEPVLFGRSIAENIAYGDNSRVVPMEEVVRAAQKANVHSFVKSLPAGYDTQVGSQGSLLSGGQKQRVAIARAILRNPKVLLLDEATSALDSESEKAVQEALEQARAGRSCITVAHRLSTVQNADRIFVVHDGVVKESGTHRHLMSLRGIYYNLYSAGSF